MLFDGGSFIHTDPTTGARFEPKGPTLAASFKAIHFDAREGNAAALAESARNPNIAPLAVAWLSGMAWESQRTAGFKAWLVWEGVGTKAYQHFLNNAEMPVQVIVRTRIELAQALEPRRGAPLMIRWLGGGGYNLVPDIAVAANGDTLFDVGSTTQSGGIEWLVRKIGADKLFLASNAPLCFDRAAPALLAGANLDEESRTMIEEGTLRRVLAQC